MGFHRLELARGLFGSALSIAGGGVSRCRGLLHGLAPASVGSLVGGLMGTRFVYHARAHQRMCTLGASQVTRITIGRRTLERPEQLAALAAGLRDLQWYSPNHETARWPMRVAMADGELRRYRIGLTRDGQPMIGFVLPFSAVRRSWDTRFACRSNRRSLPSGSRPWHNGTSAGSAVRSVGGACVVPARRSSPRSGT